MTDNLIPAMVFIIVIAIFGFVGNSLVMIVYRRQMKRARERKRNEEREHGEEKRKREDTSEMGALRFFVMAISHF